ncbi:MAG: hypothetical protein LBJ63_07850 [Prevotellaceae bacterium]|jgi:hypothetical protein|nr:hypothetical protein [Prevotellaceae bacterium]
MCGDAIYQYPQYLYALKNGEAIQDPITGNWETTSSVWELKGVCREETNGKGHTIVNSGGETIVFSSLIQIPKGTPRINEGAEILVIREKVDTQELLDNDFIAREKISGLIVTNGKCMKYDFGRLHCRLWI